MAMNAHYAVVIPSYNSGALLVPTVLGALAFWPDVFVVIDGSTDGSESGLADFKADHAGLRVVRCRRNAGKGRAVQTGAEQASRAGFTHILTMDADGQHPAGHIMRLIEASQRQPDAMILGRPIFGPEAPRLRVWGRLGSNSCAWIESGAAVADSLFGFRIYPVAPLLAVLRKSLFMRGFDFDPEVAVRLCWAGVPAVNLAVPVRYLSRGEGGISHFRYGRDNLRLTFMHLRLGLCWLLRCAHETLRQTARRTRGRNRGSRYGGSDTP